MSEGVIPGLDGDIPSERRLLPDSLTAMRTKDGAPTVAFGGQQSAAEPGRDAARDHPPKVSFVIFVVVSICLNTCLAEDLQGSQHVKVMIE